MTLSIRIKAVLPALIFGVLLAVFLAAANYAVHQVSDMTESLAERFHEIEDVRQIDIELGRVVYPHVDYLVTYDADAHRQAREIFFKLREHVTRLHARPAVNADEHRFLDSIMATVQRAEAVSANFFATPVSEHHHAMRLLLDLADKHIAPLNQTLHAWHDGETAQVQELKAQIDLTLTRVVMWGVLLIAVAILVMVFTLWLNNRMLLRPILSISRSASVLASGNLKEHAPVYYNDEIGGLATAINAMAESLDGLYARLDAQAHTDALTGLLNRRAFEDIAEREVSAARRYGRRFALVMVDIDHFKAVNDLYGHQIGDAVLAFVAQRCRSALRDSDYCFRYGGEEFVLLLQQNDSQGALLAAERCRAAIQTAVCSSRGHDIQVTASFGIACFPRAGGDLASLTAHADKALYAAKTAGRNRCIAYTDLDNTV